MFLEIWPLDIGLIEIFDVLIFFFARHWLAWESNYNVSLYLLIVLDGILNNVEQDELVHSPVRNHCEIKFLFLEDVHINFSFINLVLERPKYIWQLGFNLGARAFFEWNLVLRKLHSCNLVWTVVPNWLGWLFDTHDLLHRRLGFLRVVDNLF